MNERVERRQGADTRERGRSRPARPSLSEVGFRNHREGRAGCDLRECLSLQNTSRAQAPGLSQPARNQEV